MRCAFCSSEARTIGAAVVVCADHYADLRALSAELVAFLNRHKPRAPSQEHSKHVTEAILSDAKADEGWLLFA